MHIPAEGGRARNQADDGSAKTEKMGGSQADDGSAKAEKMGEPGERRDRKGGRAHWAGWCPRSDAGMR